MHKNCLRTLDGRLRTICGHLWMDFNQGLMDFTIFAKCSIHVRTPTLIRWCRRRSLNSGRKLKLHLVKNWNFTKIVDIFMFLSLLRVFTSVSRFSRRFLDGFWSNFVSESKQSMILAVFKLKTPRNQWKCCFNFRSACTPAYRVPSSPILRGPFAPD